MSLPPQQLEHDLEATAEALADCYDRSVFLERLMVRTARLSSVPDLLGLLGEAAGELGCRGIALFADGAWRGDVPGWLARYPAPERRFRERGQGLHGLPFGRGWIALWGKEGGLNAYDARIADALAQMVGAAWENLEAQALRERLRLQEYERQLAGEIWRTLVPAEVPAPEGYGLYSLFQPAREVGGDFQTAHGAWRVLGDISGKGLPAAMHSGLLTGLMPLILSQPDPVAAMVASATPALERSEVFATLALLHLHPEGRVGWFSFGHPPLLLRRRDGAVERFRASAPPLGLFPPASHDLNWLHLEPGELLLVYSDGLIEAEGEQGLYGLERVAGLLAHHPRPQEFLLTLERDLSGFSIVDDLSLQLYEFRGAA